MTWLVESFDVRTEELLAEIDLDALASDAVERLIGALPEALTPDQVRVVVAPLFDIDPERWGTVTRSSTGVGTPGTYPVSWEAAQGLLHRFSSDVRVPPGGVFLDLVGS